MTQGRKKESDIVKNGFDVAVEIVMPDAPPYLTGLAREEWFRCVHELCKKKTLNPIDESTLAVYCTMYEQWRKCIYYVEIHGPILNLSGQSKGAPRTNPALKTATELSSKLLLFSRHFGFTPGGRKMLGVKEDKVNPGDALKVFLDSTNEVVEDAENDEDD